MPARTFLLTRAIGLTSTPLAILLATIITAAGATAIHLTAGHSVFLPGLYLPLLLYFFFRAIDSGALRNVFLAGACAGADGIQRRRAHPADGGCRHRQLCAVRVRLLPLVAAAVLAAVFFVAGFALAAPELLPVSIYVTGDTFWDTRNATEHPDRMTLDLLTHAYLDPTEHRRLSFALQRHRWQEYGNNIEPLAILLIAMGIVISIVTRDRPGRPSGRALALTALLLFVLSLGEFATLAPASLAHALPLFSRLPDLEPLCDPLHRLWSHRRGVGCPSHRQPSALGAAGRSHGRGNLCPRLIAAGRLNRHFFERVFREAPTFDTAFHFMSGPAELAIDGLEPLSSRIADAQRADGR